jgi:competence protein ComEC
VTSIYLAALVAGIWLLQQRAILPDLTNAAILVPLAVLSIVLARQPGLTARAIARAAAALAFLAAGFFWAAAVGQWKLADDLPEIWEGRDVEISGVVAEMVHPNEHGVRFLFDVERSYTLNARIPSRISLMWYTSGDESPPGLHAGQRWRLPVRLHRPHGNSNPDGFDSEAWMLERGIRAVGYIRAEPAPSLMEPFVRRPGYLLERLREAVRTRLF